MDSYGRDGILVDHAMTDNHSTIITARGEERVAGMVAHLADSLLMVSAGDKNSNRDVRC